MASNGHAVADTWDRAIDEIYRDVRPNEVPHCPRIASRRLADLFHERPALLDSSIAAIDCEVRRNAAEMHSIALP